MWSNANIKVTCRRSSDNFLAHAALQEGLNAERSHESVQTKRTKKTLEKPTKPNEPSRAHRPMLRYACPLAQGVGVKCCQGHMFCFMLFASSLCGCSQALLVSLVLSCLVLTLRSACLFAYKGSGSYVHFCPRPCLSTCRWPTDIGDHSVCLPCSRA